jgi:Rrf2 family protein
LKFSTKTRYGLRAMIEIARNEKGEGVYQKDISKNQDISIKYLDQIIQSLKQAGLITSVKGKKSGYMITRNPSEITMYDIHRAFENNICVIDCTSDFYSCTRQDTCEAKQFWKGLNDTIIDYLKNTTLEMLLSMPIGQTS